MQEMRCLLDTSILIEAEKKQFDLAEWVLAKRATIWLCDTTITEFLVGRPCKDSRRQSNFDEFFTKTVARYARLPVTGEDFIAAGQALNAARCRGWTLPLGDGLHAAVAKAYHLTVLTKDSEHFKQLGANPINPLLEHPPRHAPA